MLNVDELVKKLEIPDGMTVSDMRAVVVDLLDMVKASNDEETAIATERDSLKVENDRLSKQNLDLFNRVTTASLPSKPNNEEKEDEVEEITTEDIVNYYN